MNNKTIFGWCMYDWANSAFITCITVTFLPRYYLTLFADPQNVELPLFGGVYHTYGDALWSYTTAVSMLLVILIAPVLGAIADMSRGKKSFLVFCVITGAIATATLSMVTMGDFFLCSGLFIVANFMWSAANIFYDGFLPEMTDDPKRMDAISAKGYGVGYLGGGIALLLCLFLFAGNEIIGLNKGEAIRLTFLVVAIWWALFTIPLYRHVNEKGERSVGVKPFKYIRDGFRRLAHTIRKIQKLPNLGRMLAAFLLYNAGIGTIQVVAVVYGVSELNLTDSTLFGVILMIQILGFPATFAYIKFAEKVGTRSSILTGLAIFTFIVVFAMQMATALEFWIMGVLVALAQGGTQAMSRSLYGSMIPENMNAEFFGFFSIFNKVGPFFGPSLFGVVKDVTGSSRLAIFFLITFFILGFLVLLTVNSLEGREEAKRFKAS